MPQEDAGLTAQRKHTEELREHAVKVVFGMRDRVGKAEQVLQLYRQAGAVDHFGPVERGHQVPALDVGDVRRTAQLHRGDEQSRADSNQSSLARSTGATARNSSRPLPGS